MTVLFWILLAVAVFLAAVLFHELGHFVFARMSGMKVEEFGIGIPPFAKRLGKDSRGTEYTLNWLPIGGFVRIKGEDELELHDKHSDAFAAKPYHWRAAVLLAGVAFNFMLAFFIFAGLFWTGVAPLAVNTRFETDVETRLVPSFERAVELGVIKASGVELSPIAGSPAERAWILKGDSVLAVAWSDVRDPAQFISRLKAASSRDQSVNIALSRSGSEFSVSVVPENSKIGAYVAYETVEYDRSFRYEYPFPQAVAAWAQETVAQIRFTFEMLGTVAKKLVFPVTETDRKEAVEGVGGPIAIGGLFVDLVSAKAGIGVVLTVAALLSINLGAFNLLPIPALDGGRFLLMTVAEPLRFFGGSARVRDFERNAHAFWFVFFLLLAVVVAFHDVWKLLQ